MAPKTKNLEKNLVKNLEKGMSEEAEVPEQPDVEPPTKKNKTEAKKKVAKKRKTILTKEERIAKDRMIAKALEPPTERTVFNHTDTIARAKVLKVLHDYKQIFEQLSRDKEARRGGDLFNATARIGLQAQAVLENAGNVVNFEKRIGSVPGIEVGDVFQYKTELRIIGLHSRTMCGIDYMKIGNVKFAKSIVASEGYGYDDKFGSDIVEYTGEGGNVIHREKQSEDQKLDKGNLALANSMEYKKRYVYDGLYL